MNQLRAELAQDMISVIQQFAGQPVLYRPNPGNAGDSAINCAAYTLLNRFKCPFEVLTDDTTIDRIKGRIVLYGGGGSFVPLYDAASRFIEANHKYCKQLVVLPHTVRGHESLLCELAPNVTIMCRDVESYVHVCKSSPNAKAVLTHDLAFQLVPPIVQKEGRELFWPMLPSAEHAIYSLKRSILTSIYRVKSFGKRELNAFRRDEEGTGTRSLKMNIDASGVFAVRDMSPKWAIETTANLFNFLNTFDVVRTDRLHIGILSALLGKTVELFDNSYGKNRAVFEHSMKSRYPNVSMPE